MMTKEQIEKEPIEGSFRASSQELKDIVRFCDDAHEERVKTVSQINWEESD